MKYPFGLPVHKVQPDILLWEIRDCNGKLLLRTGIGNGELVDYLVQVINSHEKFKTALEIIRDLEDHHSKTGIGYDKVTHELVKDALEAEKP